MNKHDWKERPIDESMIAKAWFITVLLRYPEADFSAGMDLQAALTGTGRNLIVAMMPNKTKSDSTTSCVSLNGGSVCVGAIASSAGIFSNACTTATKRLK